MERKNTFFESLEPKSALVVGVVAGILTLCTIGFVILLFTTLNDRATAGRASEIANVPSEENAPQQTTVPKSDKPEVELFVMSYCPYGLQMEKAFLPVMDLLQKKADLSIKFVYYAMHGLPELQENTRQYCLETEQPDKFIPYMQCFVNKDDSSGCLSLVKANQSKLNACVIATDKKYGTIEKYNDKTTWLGGNYPVYPIHQDLNDKYGVQGSPSLVINGVESSAARTPEAIKEAVCAAFNNPPAECEQSLSNSAPSAGFGTASGSGSATNAACGS